MTRLTPGRERSRPFLAVLSALACLTVAAHALAQDLPFVGRVVADQGAVRAGPGNAYYVVGTLKKGTLVTVEDTFASSWYKVMPPKGVFSYVPAADVDVRADGKVGTIRGSKVAVKAASENGPGESYKTQLRLDKGDIVQIVAKEGEYLKILPPKNSYVYVRQTMIEEASLSATVVEPAGGSSNVGNGTTTAVEETTTMVEETTTTTVEETTTTVEEVVDTTVDSGTDAAVDVMPPDGGTESLDEREGGMDEGTDAVAEVTEITETTVTVTTIVEPAVGSETLRKLEERFDEQMLLPLEQRDSNGMLLAYQEIAADPSITGVEHKIASMRIRRLQRDVLLSEAMAEINAARADIKAGAKPAVVEEIKPEPGPQYDVVGKLLASRVYDGRRLPRLYRLVAVSDLSTLAYIRPSRELDGTYFGQVVGIIGRTQFDPELKVQLVEVDQLDVLGAQ